jgi:acyl-coenzyme A synthetase/AMP-(fatty) acid ligase
MIGSVSRKYVDTEMRWAVRVMQRGGAGGGKREDNASLRAVYEVGETIGKERWEGLKKCVGGRGGLCSKYIQIESRTLNLNRQFSPAKPF